MYDRRVRLRPKPGGENYVYGDLGITSVGGNATAGLLSILRETGGMVWNITPTVSEQRTVAYDNESPVHSNASYNSYRTTPNVSINVSGTFIATTPAEAYYNLACIHFLRTVTKMDSGRIAASVTNPEIAVAGAPPPVLLFSGYGDFMFGDIPVIVKSINMTYSDDVDYIKVPISSASTEYLTKLGKLKKVSANREDETYFPAKLTLSVTLEQQPMPDFMSKQFNLNDFKRGALIKKRGLI